MSFNDYLQERFEGVEGTNKVVAIEHLAGSGGTRANGKREDVDGVVDGLSDLIGNGFDFQSDGASLFNGF